ncbi:hypothetical protein [Nonomuraea sp. NPDC049695]
MEPDRPDVAGMRAYADELRTTFLRLQEQGDELRRRAQAAR